MTNTNIEFIHHKSAQYYIRLALSCHFQLARLPAGPPFYDYIQAALSGRIPSRQGSRRVKEGKKEGGGDHSLDFIANNDGGKMGLGNGHKLAQWSYTCAYANAVYLKSYPAPMCQIFRIKRALQFIKGGTCCRARCFDHIVSVPYLPR